MPSSRYTETLRSSTCAITNLIYSQLPSASIENNNVGATSLLSVLIQNISASIQQFRNVDPRCTSKAEKLANGQLGFWLTVVVIDWLCKASCCKASQSWIKSIVVTYEMLYTFIPVCNLEYNKKMQIEVWTTTKYKHCQQTITRDDNAEVAENIEWCEHCQLGLTLKHL